MIADNKDARAGEAAIAERIVEGEVDTFCKLARRPRRRADDGGAPREDRAHPRGEIARYLAAAGASLDDRPARARIERLTRTIVNKILHAPLSELRRARPTERDALRRRRCARSFRLGVGHDREPDDEDE